MSHPSLERHYEKKYAAEKSGSSLPLVPLKPVPLTRFEAAIKYFPRFFQGGDVLELGAGNGLVANTLLHEHPEIRSYTLGDLSQARVEGIRRSINDDRLKTLELDAEQLPDDLSTQYDAVIMIALIEHLVDPLRAMQAIRKLLKPNGIVYIDTPNIAKYTHRIKLMRGRFPSTASTNEGLSTYDGAPVDLHDEGHLHYFTYRSLSLMLTDRCGFSGISKMGYSCGPNHFGHTLHDRLAQAWPEMFSELLLVAHA